MDIRLRRLRLKNFKGVKSFMLDAAESDWVNIYGRNGSGKSTLADALSWLFFGKNQVGDSSFSIKTLNESAQEIHHLEHEVEAVLEVDGKELTLRKVMTEKWAKKRGSQSPEFGGHETTYYIHEVPRKQKEYQDEVAGLVREDLFRMLSSITHFNSMRWQDRRKILLEVIGSIEDAEVIAAHGDRFIEIPVIMDGRSYDDTIKMLRGRRPKIADELNVIPARVDEANRSIPGDGACMPPQGESYSGLTARLSGLQNKRAAVLAGDTSEVRTMIADKKAQIDAVALKHQRVVMELEDHRRQLNAEARECRSGMERLDARCVTLEQERARLGQQNEQLRDEYRDRAKAEAPSATCSLCGQSLPEQKAGEVLAKFNHDRAVRLGAIQEAGRTNKERIEKIDLEIKASNAEWDELRGKKEALEEQVAALVDPEGPSFAILNAELTSLQLKLTSQGTVDTVKIDAEIEQVRDQIRRYDDATANIKIAAQSERRIEELKADQKRFGAELDELDRKLMLCEEFTRAKVGMLEGRVSEKFAPLSFRLFEDQINGGLRETCETLIPSPDGAMVPYSDANTGHRILAGLRIIEVLGGHFGIHTPVFIDGAESLTEGIPEIGSQVIRLVASSDESSGLTVERREMKAAV